MDYRYSVSKKFKFEMAHCLDHLDYESKCKHVHGHSYMAEIELFSNELDMYGMVLDFNNFKPFKQYIDDVLDHNLLCCKDNCDKFDKFEKLAYIPNDLKYTTSENIADYLVRIFKELVINQRDCKHIKAIKCIVSETGNNKATYFEDL
jgi:6-pyruvoyltetrahydropterin/6-carboxytetrahydropterin synthase